MAVHTQTAQFKASPEKLFQFMSDIENLPKWATSYVQSIRKDGEDYYAITPEGELYQRFEIDERVGTIDMLGGPNKDELWSWPARVMSDNLGGSLLVFSCIQMPDQSDDDFAGQCQTLEKEFENIKQHVDS